MNRSMALLVKKGNGPFWIHVPAPAAWPIGSVVHTAFPLAVHVDAVAEGSEKLVSSRANLYTNESF